MLVFSPTVYDFVASIQRPRSLHGMVHCDTVHMVAQACHRFHGGEIPFGLGGCIMSNPLLGVPGK